MSNPAFAPQPPNVSIPQLRAISPNMEVLIMFTDAAFTSGTIWKSNDPSLPLGMTKSDWGPTIPAPGTFTYVQS